MVLKNTKENACPNIFNCGLIGTFIKINYVQNIHYRMREMRTRESLENVELWGLSQAMWNKKCSIYWHISKSSMLQKCSDFMLWIWKPETTMTAEIFDSRVLFFCLTSTEKSKKVALFTYSNTICLKNNNRKLYVSCFCYSTRRVYSANEIRMSLRL